MCVNLELNKRIDSLSHIVDDMIESSKKSEEVDAYITYALSTSFNKTLIV